MKIDITSSQYNRMIDVMTDVLFENLSNDEIGVLQRDIERLDNPGVSNFDDIGDIAYDIFRDIVDALDREEFVDTLVVASIVRMFE